MKLAPVVLTAFLNGVIVQSSYPAPTISDNVPGTVYTATLSSGPGEATGSVQIAAASSGVGVRVDISWIDFELNNVHEYTYHIHQKPVTADGNCNGTAAHFDNHNVTDDFVCDSSRPEYCQLGDLSGKHGIIKFENQNYANLSFMDNYLSTNPNNAAYFGNLSIVVHKKSNKFRLKCGNFSALIASNSSDVDSGSTMIFPNATTSTEMATASTVEQPGTSTPGKSMNDAQGTGSGDPASNSPMSTGGFHSENGGSNRRVGEHFLAMVIEAALFVGLV